MSLVSIIVRAKNEEYWLPKLLYQFRKQTFKDFEVILVDNESQDSTKEIFRKEWPEGKVFEIGNFKPGKAINTGIEQAKSEYIVIISAHCVPTNEFWLENFVKTLSDKNVGASYGRQLPLSTSHPFDKRDLLNTFGIEFRVQKKDTFFHNANSILRRSVWEKYPFDEDTPHIEDRIWASHLIENGIWIAYTPDASVFHHHGINHHENFKRAEAISQILGRNKLGYSHELPEFLKPDHAKTLYCLLGHDMKSHSNYQKFLGKMKLDARPGKIVVHSSNPELLSNDSDVVSYSREDADKTFVEILNELLSYETKNSFFPDAIAYVNLRADNLHWKRLKEAIDSFYDGMYDSVFWANREFNNVWQKEKEAYVQIRADYTKKEKKEPIYISRYGLGLVTLPSLIRSSKLIGSNIAILTLEEEDIN